MGDIERKKFFKNSKTSCPVFFRTAYNILRENKIQISENHG